MGLSMDVKDGLYQHEHQQDGLCVDCGAPLTVDDSSRCPVCAHKHTAKRKAQRRKKVMLAEFRDTHVCRDCHQPFVLAATEIEFFMARKLVLPSRCVDCRRLRKEAARRSGDATDPK
jgi:hypothetical protein